MKLPQVPHLLRRIAVGLVVFLLVVGGGNSSAEAALTDIHALQIEEATARVSERVT